MTEKREFLLQQLDEKFKAIDQNTDVHLEGLLHATPITYWDYILPESLLSLQVQRSNLPDEMVFIMYHQINELLFKMILWEIDQVSNSDNIEAAFFTEKLRRISRYFDMLSTSFSIMGDGMDIEQYQKFRNTLTPASGFQSAQYRLIEFASTELINLIDYRFRATIDRNTPYSHAYDHLYWQAAGKDHATGKKNTLIVLFERKYRTMFLRKMEEYNTTNLYTRFKQLPDDVRQDAKLIAAMRHYDKTVNITWVMAHYHAAGKYLGEAAATGGSDWRKYMHPRYQRRIFFPDLWSAEELEHWGEDA
ncbi:MAG: tryptophan 2,3-dioxygenase [Chitinophagaceae bacterium]|nr:tryptophan 2,3-dioxygenase [Chitinophagaceae bacterium]